MTSAHIPPSADVVIVGAGSAGCVLAERLSREQGRSVILIDHAPTTPGQPVALRAAAGQIFPGGTAPAALPDTIAKTLKEAAS